MVGYGRAGMTGLSYSTGALMFFALYRTLGEEAFDRALSAWFRKYRSTGSTTQEFMDATQASSGQTLAPLFRDWLITAGWYERLRGGKSLEQIIGSYRE
jgi:aminopeptidase N